jgi:hypothetical protein
MSAEDGSGHPVPESEEARHNEIPEHLEARKGEGDDGREAVQATKPVNPDGEPYEAGDLGRGPQTHQEK